MAPRKYRHLGWVEAELWDLADSESFAFTEEPEDWSELAHERHAYESAFQQADLRSARKHA